MKIHTGTYFKVDVRGDSEALSAYPLETAPSNPKVRQSGAVQRACDYNPRRTGCLTSYAINCCVTLDKSLKLSGSEVLQSPFQLQHGEFACLPDLSQGRVEASWGKSSGKWNVYSRGSERTRSSEAVFRTGRNGRKCPKGKFARSQRPCMPPHLLKHSYTLLTVAVY